MQLNKCVKHLRQCLMNKWLENPNMKETLLKKSNKNFKTENYIWNKKTLDIITVKWKLRKNKMSVNLKTNW